ncbi:MAG: sugar phosphate isomerase/epimerase [Lachnospiraceae bacterium]|nr:sugar phosphate isomerase/epimerase [Lachnospiraceae bacterium]
MQIGIRLHDAVDLPLPERLAAVKEQGFCCVHMALTKTKGLAGAPEALTPGYASYIRHTYEEAGVDLGILGCYLNLANPDPEALKKIQDQYTAYLRFASYIGGGVIVGTETGAPNTGYKYDKEACHSEEALRIFITNLRPVIKAAEKLGVILAIEPVYKHIVWNPKRARIVLDAIDSPNLQIIFDPVNLLNGDNLDHRDEVIAEAIDLLGKEICFIHLKDYLNEPTEDGSLPSLACGLGEMDYRQVLRFAKERKPFIQMTLEDTKPDNAEQARKMLENIAAGL